MSDHNTNPAGCVRKNSSLCARTDTQFKTRNPQRQSSPKTLEDDRGAYVLDVIRAAGRDVEATLKKIVGNAQAAKVLRWSLYWSGKSTFCSGDTFFKTRREWQDEAGMSEANLKTAVKHLRKFPWWKDKAHLQPNGRRAQHYTVDVEAMLDQVLSVLEPRRLRLVGSPFEEVKLAPKVEQELEANPVDSTGLNPPTDARLMLLNQPDQSGETNRVNSVESTVSSLHAIPTSTNTYTQDSHLACSREAVASPAQEERENFYVDMKEKGEGEETASKLADYLISVQRDLLGTTTPKDPAAALDLARYAIDHGLSLPELEMVCREKMNELSLGRKPYCGLYAAASRIGSELNRRRITATSIASALVVTVETEEQRIERKRLEAELAQADQASREHEQATAQAEGEQRQRQAENERIAGLIGQLEEISAGHIEGVSVERESAAMGRLVRSHQPEFLRAAFEWFASNLKPGEVLCWETIDFGMPRYKSHLQHPNVAAKKFAWAGAAEILNRLTNTVE